MAHAMSITRGAIPRGPDLTSGLIRWLRRFWTAPANQASLLTIESRVNLGPKKSLVLVSCCGQRVLLALSGDSVTTLKEIESPRQPAARRRTGR